MTHTHTHTHTLGRTPLDKWSARRRDHYLATHNTHKRQTSMLPAVFEPAVPASKRPQTHILDRAATGIGVRIFETVNFQDLEVCSVGMLWQIVGKCQIGLALYDMFFPTCTKIGRLVTLMLIFLIEWGHATAWWCGEGWALLLSKDYGHLESLFIFGFPIL
jgi:hypothetical protein